MDTQIITTIAALSLALSLSFASDVAAQGAAQRAVQGAAQEGTNEPPEDAFVSQSVKDLIGEKKSAWIEEMRSTLVMAHREVGPFGLAQDPNAKPAQQKEQNLKPGAFLAAIAAIEVNAVIPSENKFIVQSREFSEGDKFPIIRDQRQFNIEITSVKSNYITFKNVDTGEHLKKNLNTLPDGMKKNGRIDSVPGVMAANKKNLTPLVLDQIQIHTIQQH